MWGVGVNVLIMGDVERGLLIVDDVAGEVFRLETPIRKVLIIGDVEGRLFIVLIMRGVA